MIFPFLSFQEKKKRLIKRITSGNSYTKDWGFLEHDVGFEFLHASCCILQKLSMWLRSTDHDLQFQNVRTMFTSLDVDYSQLTILPNETWKKAGYQNWITSSINPKQTLVQDGAKYASGLFWIIGLF